MKKDISSKNIISGIREIRQGDLLAEKSYMKDRYRNMHLPEKAIVRYNSEYFLTREYARIAHYTYLVYVLSDVLYSLLFELDKQMLQFGQDLKYESKKRYNDFFDLVKKLKKRASDISIDVHQSMRSEGVEEFQDVADYFLEMNMSIYDRFSIMKDIPIRMISTIKNFMPKSDDEIYLEYLEGVKRRFPDKGISERIDEIMNSIGYEEKDDKAQG